jgi:hypothetical protein
MYTVRQPRVARFRVAAAMVGLGCAALLVAPAPAPAAADGAFVPGSGDAVANVGRLVARASGLPLAVTYGGALAHYQGTTGRGEAATLDLGVLGVLLSSPSACGRAPLSPDQLPKRTVADSRAGAASASRDVAGAGPVGAGREEASARPDAKGDAAYTSAALGLGELLAAGEGRSASTVELVDGKERRASASVRFGNVDLAGGLVSLRGLRWSAEQHTGAGGAVVASGGTFGLDTIVVAGIPLPTDTPLKLGAAFGAADKVLAPFGLRVEPPAVTKTTGDREVRVTPLKLVLGDGTAARPLLGPVMGGVQPAREALLAAMKGIGRGGDCNLGQAGGLALTFVDVAAAAMEGAGGIDVELGGVLATTEGVDYGDPFGLIPPGLPTVAPVAAPAVPPRPPAPTTPSDAGEALPAFDPSATATAVPAPAAPAPAPVAARAVPAPAAAGPVAVAPATRGCESTSRGRVSGCSRGAPVPAGAAALGVAGLLFGGDWWRARRRPTRGGPT